MEKSEYKEFLLAANTHLISAEGFESSISEVSDGTGFLVLLKNTDNSDVFKTITNPLHASFEYNPLSKAKPGCPFVRSSVYTFEGAFYLLRVLTEFETFCNQHKMTYSSIIQEDLVREMRTFIQLLKVAVGWGNACKKEGLIAVKFCEALFTLVSYIDSTASKVQCDLRTQAMLEKTIIYITATGSNVSDPRVYYRLGLHEEPFQIAPPSEYSLAFFADCPDEQFPRFFSAIFNP